MGLNGEIKVPKFKNTYFMIDSYESLKYDRDIDINSMRIKLMRHYGMDLTGDKSQFRNLPPNVDLLLVDYGGEAIERPHLKSEFSRQLFDYATENPSTTIVICSEHTQKFYYDHIKNESLDFPPNVQYMDEFFVDDIELDVDQRIYLDQLYEQSVALINTQQKELDQYN